MAAYEFGILRRGTPRPSDEPAAESQRLQNGHLANMNRMAEAGLLRGAGPLLDDGDIRGVFIFVANQRARIDEMVKADPLISAGRLVLELHPWWGPKGVGDAYFADHQANPKADDRMANYQLAFLVAGPNRKPGDGEAPETQKINEGHMAHIRAMGDAGKLLAAGPFVDDGTLRGILVMRAASLDEARTLASQDPAVKAGRLVVDIHPWMVAEGVIPVVK